MHPPLPHTSSQTLNPHPHAPQIDKLRERVSKLTGVKRSLRDEVKRLETNIGRMADSAVCGIGWHPSQWPSRCWDGVVWDGRRISRYEPVEGVAVPPPAP